MAGKMTILDRLAKEGRIPRNISGSLSRGLKISGEFRDPLSYPLQDRSYFGKPSHVARTEWIQMTPERQVYQRGLQAIRNKELADVNDRYDDAENMLQDLQADFSADYDEAYAAMKEDVFSENADAPSLAEGFDPRDDLHIGSPGRVDLYEYWPSYTRSPDEYASEAEDYVDQMKGFTGRTAYLESPEYLMELQAHSPRYRNYQRVMEQRAANKAVGRDLSRRYATAVRNLVRRGLSPEEADAYVRRYFGTR